MIGVDSAKIEECVFVGSMRSSDLTSVTKIRYSLGVVEREERPMEVFDV